MTEVHRIQGPPGTGKTLYVERQCAIAAEKYGPEHVLACSLTRAAARELGSRAKLPPDRVGTLHSFAWRALGRPKLVDRGQVKDWNAAHPAWALPPERACSTSGEDGVERSDEGAGAREFPGDPIFAEVDLLRSRMAPPQAWPSRTRDFHRAWAAFKQEAGVLDFTDLIEEAARAVPVAPGAPAALFVDERQDLSALEGDLVARWARSADHLVLVGDPDQALYTFRGADPEAMAGPLHKVLADSFRVPRAVHAEATALIGRASSRREVNYRARPADGRVARSEATCAAPEAALEAEVGQALAGDAAAWPRLLVLAACDYMLERSVKWLRERGIPYHNPYSGGRWSPLAGGSGTPSARRLRDLLSISPAHAGEAALARWTWSAREIRSWAPVVKAGDGEGCVLLRGGKAAAEELAEDASDSEAAAFVARWVSREVASRLIDGDLGFVAECLVPSKRQAMEYPLAVLRERGAAALVETPRVAVGTVHSVKGGQADSVIVFPDLSPSGYQQYRVPGWAGRDAALRLFYVAYTRARESLTICRPAGGRCCTEVS